MNKRNTFALKHYSILTVKSLNGQIRIAFTIIVIYVINFLDLYSFRGFDTEQFFNFRSKCQIKISIQKGVDNVVNEE